MKLLFDFFPILLFFIVYKFFGIYLATIVAMGVSLLQIGYFWLKHRRLEITHIITLVLFLILGTATVLFRNEIFVKWKPTAVYWVFSLLLLGSQITGSKPFIQRIIGEKIILPQSVWQRLNLSWAIFFAGMGALNLYIAYRYSTDTWVNFKLFGTLATTVAFVILQSLYMAKYLKQSQEQTE